jgi:hypothetical protein
MFKPRPELFSTQVQAIVSVTRQADENQVEVDRDRYVGLKIEAWFRVSGVGFRLRSTGIVT